MNKFITILERKKRIEKPDICLIQFCSNYYHDSYFQHYKIPMPIHIKNSVDKRKAEYLVGRLCVKELLALNQYNNEHDISTGKFGEPIFPSLYSGSISHNNHYAVSILGKTKHWLGIGVDIENIIHSDLSKVIQQQVINGDEYILLLHTKSSLTLNELLTLCFSAKEAFYKAISHLVKRYLDFNEIEIIAIYPEKQSIELLPSLSIRKLLGIDQSFFGCYSKIDASTIITEFFIVT